MLSKYYHRLEQLITRYAPYWGETLWMLDNYDDTKTVIENADVVAKAFGCKNKTGKNLLDCINRGICKGSDGTIRSFTELKKVI